MAAAPDPVELRRAVERKAEELGFALVGVTRAAPTARRAELERWLEEGRHGEMRWLAERVGEMCDVRTMLAGARSVICVADRYHDGRPDRVESSRGQGRIARYARGKDYHDLVRDRLRKIARLVRELVPGSQTRNCHDIQPVLEREQAARALLGAIGKHTLLLRPGLGSYFLLGEVITDAEIAPSDAPPGFAGADSDDTRSPGPGIDACGACTRCVVSSALKRATLPMMKRNALLALAGIARGQPALLEAARARCRSIVVDGAEDEIVVAAARSALAALA